MPVFILFKYGNKLTLSVIDRRLNKKDQSRDVLEKITMIKDVRIDNPHHAHIDIFYDLSKDQLYNKFHFPDFDGLHKAWKETLNIKELNNRFYKELSNWYFWAMQNVVFPGATSEQDKESLFVIQEKQKEFNAQCLIRLICRLLFVWFIKEKHLVSEKFFSEVEIKKLIKTDTNESSAYYKAILQNLFFAVLNQEKDKRDYKKENNYSYGNEFHYRHLIKNPDAFKKEFEDVPFMNGGLFECLDEVKRENKGNSTKEVTRKYYFDGFSDRPDNKLRVPDELFFAGKKIVDLSAEFDNSAKYKNVEVRGLLHILNSYKFTVEENTPIEEDVALDPELLGRVFENLLASFNPETKTTARKATGSYYTPREIVDYMVNESIKACLESTLVNQLGIEEEIAKEKLNILINYNETPNPFNNEQTRALIEAIDKLKILDPACGSGAFPMGMLHKLVYILEKLDFDNKIWKETQSKKLSEEMKKTLDISYTKDEREQLQRDINEIFDSSMYDPNYARKMYIIENCIYGVDIQPVATQISKLRFFISLVTEQKTDPSKPNCGVRPLPNLETKFIAANTLIDITNSGFLKSQKIIDLEKELKEIRHKIFSVKTVETKLKYRDKDKEKRKELAEELHRLNMSVETSRALANWDPYDKKKSSPWFNPEWMFGIKDGFDIVIGNPPYIGEKGHKELFRPVAQTKFGQKYYSGKMDYFYFFFHKALDLGKNQAEIAFITTNYYPTAFGGKILREDLKNRTQIRKLINFNELKIFESALGQHNMITFLTKNKNKPIISRNSICKISEIANNNLLNKILYANDTEEGYFNLYNVEQRFLYEGKESYIRIAGCNTNVENSADSILKKISNSDYLLKDIAIIKQGIVSGADKYTDAHEKKYNLGHNKGMGIFILNKNELQLLNFPDKEKIFIKKVYKNSDISKYIINYKDELYCLYITRSTKENDIPNIIRYLSKFKPLLEERLVRYNENYHWYSLHRERDTSILESKEKIVNSRRAKSNIFALETKQYYEQSDLMITIIKDQYKNIFPTKYVLGLLNSRLYYFWLKNKGKLKGDSLELYGAPLEEIPIKPADNELKSKIIQIVDQILDKKKSDPKSDTSDLEHQIDLLVYDLYGLTDDEIAIVEGN